MSIRLDKIQPNSTLQTKQSNMDYLNNTFQVQQEPPIQPDFTPPMRESFTPTATSTPTSANVISNREIIILVIKATVVFTFLTIPMVREYIYSTIPYSPNTICVINVVIFIAVLFCLIKYV